MASKTDIFNLALNALLLQRRIVDADTDPGNEANVLRGNWTNAYRSALADLNLDSTYTFAPLAVAAQNYPIRMWFYAYLYPADSVRFRRIQSEVVDDNRYSHIEKRTAIYAGQKVIFSNEAEAIGEYISVNTDPLLLSEVAALAVAYRLAWQSAPLITGKGAKELRDSLKDDFIIAKAQAQGLDGDENYNYADPEVVSEFVAERMS